MSHGPLSSRVRAARRLAATKGWRGVMEGLRPITAELWAETDLRSRRAFARRLRPWWDVHRHRLAPNLAAEIDRLRAEGRLTVHAGHIRDVSAGAEGVQVSIAPRGDAGTLSLSGRWLIDCTGPGHDPMADRLTRSLIDQGRARLDPLSLGLDLDASGRVLDAEGRADLLLFVLGPPARAAFWETIAAPDIRKRIEDVADALAAV